MLHSVEQIIIFLTWLITFSFLTLAILFLRLLLDERGWNLAINWCEALRAELKALNALSMEHMSRVATELHNILTVITIGLIIVVYELALKFISLHLKLLEWLFASLARVRVIVHEVLDATDQHWVLEFTFTNSLHEKLKQAWHWEAMLHAFDRVDDAIPQRPQDECEENQLDEGDEDEPMEEHQQAEDHL